MQTFRANRLLPDPLWTALLVALAGAFLPASTSPQGVEAADPERTRETDRKRQPVWLGVMVPKEASDPDGAPVKRVLAKSPAERAGLRAGDRILEVGGDRVEDLRSLRERLDAFVPADRVDVTYLRDGTEQTVTVTMRARPSKNQIRRDELVDEKLPASVKLRPLEAEGEVWTRETFRGRPVVLEFWATWCAPCREMEETLETLHREFGDRVRIVGVSSEKRSALEAHAEEDEPTYPIARDPDETAKRALLVSSYPTVVVLDAHGDVREIFTGLGHEQALREILESLVE